MMDIQNLKVHCNKHLRYLFFGLNKAPDIIFLGEGDNVKYTAFDWYNWFCNEYRSEITRDQIEINLSKLIEIAIRLRTFRDTLTGNEKKNRLITRIENQLN